MHAGQEFLDNTPAPPKKNYWQKSPFSLDCSLYIIVKCSVSLDYIQNIWDSVLTAMSFFSLDV